MTWLSGIVTSTAPGLPAGDLYADDTRQPVVTRIARQAHALSKNVENLDNLGQVILYLQPPLTSVTPAAKALAGVIRDANNQVALVFGACDQNLEVTKWLPESSGKLVLH